MATILIVDDQPTNRALVATLVRYAGHHALEAGDGSLALSMARQHRPDLLVCDLLMPVMDGYELVRQLRAHASTAGIRVIFYTATYLEGEARVLAAACGVQHLLFKPCEPELILQTIAQALEQPPPPHVTLPEVADFDNRHLRLLTDKLASKVDELEVANQRLNEEVCERRRATEQLQESELRFRQIADNIREVFFLSDPRGTQCYYVSPAYADIFGLSCDSLYADPKSLLQTIHDDDRAGVMAQLAQSASGAGLELECRIVLSDGRLRHIHSSVFPIRNAAGQVYRIAGVAEDVTEQVRLRIALRAREADLRRAQSLARLAHLITRPDGTFESWSDSLPGLLGVAPEHVAPHLRAWLARVHPQDRSRLLRVCAEAAKNHTPATVDYRLVSGDGGWLHLHQELEPMYDGVDKAGKPRWFSTLQDVSAQKLSEQKIHKLNRVYSMLSSINSLIVRATSREQLLWESCQVAVERGQYPLAWIGTLEDGASEGTVQSWYGDDGAYVRQIRLTLQSLRLLVCNDIRGEPALADVVDSMLARGLRSQACFPLRADQKTVGVLTLCSAELNAFDAQEVQLLQELSDNISFALDHLHKGERLNYLAYFDALTGLPNSALLTERLEQSIAFAACTTSQRMLALVLLDVVHFKAVNQAYGRQGGDALLKQLAQRLRASPDPRLLVARISADRYALLMQDMTDLGEVGHLIAVQYRQWFDGPFAIQGQVFHVSAKLGIAVYPADALDAETLYRNAESALKKAKASKERLLFYDVHMAEAVSERLALEGKLRLALEREEFVLYYQAKVDVDTRRLEGVEALIRWNSPELGLVPPVRFIYLLEESGLIVDVGLWALRRAAQDHARWRAQGLVAPRIAVNVSAVQLREADFVGRVIHLLAEQPVPQGIDIELTESLLMEDVESNIEKLNRLRDHGVRLSIDDFGTGYSSLAYLAKLPAEFLKIDRAFIRTMLDDPNTMTLVSTMISMAHSLRMKVVAEGVETEEQAKILRLLRCDQMQGYLIGQAVAFEAVRLLEQSTG